MSHAFDPAGRRAVPAGSSRVTQSPESGPGALRAAEEAGVIAAAQAGSETAFARLYHGYATRVYRFCVVRTGCHADAEDVTQQTFVRIAQALPAYRDLGLPFGAWVFRIARNSLNDHLRRRPDQPPLDPLSGPEASVPDPASQVSDRDWLLRALGALTPDQREVIELRFFAELSTREICDVMRRDPAAVRVLQARALASLRRHMAMQASPAGVVLRAVRT